MIDWNRLEQALERRQARRAPPPRGHKVLYIHSCPRPARWASSHLTSLVLGYSSAEHEHANLAEGRREHHCPWCGEAMRRVGTFVELGKRGLTEEMAEHYDEAGLQTMIADHTQLPNRGSE